MKTNVSRRQFLAASAAAVSSFCLTGPKLFAGSGKPDLKATLDTYSGFKMGIQSYSLREFNLARTIQRIADLGLHWAEFFPGHFNTDSNDAQMKEVKAQLASHRILLSVHGVHRFTADEAHNRRSFEFARRAGIPVLSANPLPASFPILHDLVQEFDIRIGIHNHGPNSNYDLTSDSLEAVAKWDKRIGFCPDTGHCMRSGEDPVEMIHQLKDRLYGMHLKDHRRIHRNNPRETILGEGALDLQGVCVALRKVGFDRPLSLECELNPKSPIADIRKGLANFAQAAKATL
jgi:sugar phosphate isomerase/epimerase